MSRAEWALMRRLLFTAPVQSKLPLENHLSRWCWESDSSLCHRAVTPSLSAWVSSASAAPEYQFEERGCSQVGIAFVVALENFSSFVVVVVQIIFRAVLLVLAGLTEIKSQACPLEVKRASWKASSDFSGFHPKYLSSELISFILTSPCINNSSDLVPPSTPSFVLRWCFVKEICYSIKW